MANWLGLSHSSETLGQSIHICVFKNICMYAKLLQSCPTL